MCDQLGIETYYNRVIPDEYNVGKQSYSYREGCCLEIVKQALCPFLLNKVIIKMKC